jgi:O-acetylserine/cysteine efflux transporter
MKPTDIALALTVPILWGFGFTLAKPAVAHFPPLLLMAMTYAVTGLCLCRRIREVKTPMATMAVLALLNQLAGGAVVMAGLAVVIFTRGPVPAPAE